MLEAAETAFSAACTLEPGARSTPFEGRIILHIQTHTDLG